MTCTCCGGYAGKWVQHWNQDTGFSVCESCTDWNGEGVTEASFRQRFGAPGENYARLPRTLERAT